MTEKTQLNINDRLQAANGALGGVGYVLMIIGFPLVISAILLWSLSVLSVNIFLGIVDAIIGGALRNSDHYEKLSELLSNAGAIWLWYRALYDVTDGFSAKMSDILSGYLFYVGGAILTCGGLS